MDWVVTYLSGSWFFETTIQLHMFQVPSFVRETLLFVVVSHESLQIQNLKLKSIYNIYNITLVLL